MDINHLTTSNIDLKTIFKLIKEIESNLKESRLKTDDVIEAYVTKICLNSYICCATSNNDIVGIISFYVNDYTKKISYITYLGILEKYRNKGIGKTLIKTCEEVSKKNNMQKIRLEVLNNNKQAISFYKKQGFAFEKKASINSIYMMKIIN